MVTDVGWYKIVFSDSEIRSGRAEELRDGFQRLFAKYGKPKDAALLHGLADLHNNYFFSPGAARIAMPIITVYGGVECSPPKRSHVGKLIANEDGNSVVFAAEP